MIDQVDRNMQDWIGSVLDGTAVSLLVPADAAKGQGVGLYLIELLQTPPARGTRRPPLQITLRYLVTSWAEDPQEAHRLLGELLFAAMDHPDFEVEQERLPLELWTALRVGPRPCFVLRVPLRRERLEKSAPLVRKPLIMKMSPVRQLQGRVLGPKEIPLMGAQVELPALLLSTQTDCDGRFNFPAVPADPTAVVLTVRAKGRSMTVHAADAAHDDTGTLVIHVADLEV